MEHPSKNDLLDFLKSENNDKSSKAVWEHLENCPECFKVMETLSSSEPTLLARYKEWTSEHENGHAIPTPEFQDSRFEVDEEIAIGGMGIVYRGQDRLIDRSVALKTVRPDAAHPQEVENRFVAEAKLCGQLEHPGIVPVYDMGQLKDGRPYLLMKLIEGRTLQDVISDAGNNQQSRLLQVFAQVCRAVGFAHSKKVVHRDLKPGNVMVGSFGVVQVMDWGLAKSIGNVELQSSNPSDELSASRDRSLTMDGTVFGTPNYMSPEQAKGNITEIDKASDVFSLGAILFEIISGTPLYSGSVANILTDAKQCQLDDRLKDLEGKCDNELLAMVRQCLKHDKALRPNDAQVLGQRLEAYLDSVDERRKQAELDEQKAVLLAKAEKKRRKLTMVFSSAVVVLVLISAGFVYHRIQTGIENERTIQNLVSEVRFDLRERKDALDETVCLESLAKMEKARLLFDFQVPQNLKAQVDKLEKQVQRNLEDLRQASAIAELDEEVLSELKETYLNSFCVPSDARGVFRNPETIAEFESVFAKYDIGVEQKQELMIEQLKGSKIKDELLRYLNSYRDVVWCTSFDPEKVKWVDDLLNEVEGQNPRKLVRQHSIKGNKDRIIEVASQLWVLKDVVAVESLTHVLLNMETNGKRRVLKKLLNRAIARYPNHLASHYFLGLSQLKNDASLALLHLSIVRAQVPYASNVLNSIGFLKVNGSKPSEAISILNEAIEHCGEETFTLTNLAAAYQMTGNLKEASRIANRVIELHPRYPVGYVTLARIQLEMEEFAKAKKTVMKALRMTPQLVPALVIASRIEYAMANFEVATRLGAKAFQLSYKNNLDYKIVENLGRCLLATERYREALAAADTMIKLTPTIGIGWEFAAMSHMGLDKYDEAIKDCEKALVFTKQKTRFYELLVQCYDNTGHAENKKKYETLLAKGKRKNTSSKDAQPKQEGEKEVRTATKDNKGDVKK